LLWASGLRSVCPCISSPLPPLTALCSPSFTNNFFIGLSSLCPGRLMGSGCLLFVCGVKPSLAPCSLTRGIPRKVGLRSREGCWSRGPNFLGTTALPSQSRHPDERLRLALTLLAQRTSVVSSTIPCKATLPQRCAIYVPVGIPSR
jgi:hypothetical protein